MQKRRHRSNEDGYALIENVAVMPVVFLIVYALLLPGLFCMPSALLNSQPEGEACTRGS